MNLLWKGEPALAKAAAIILVESVTSIGAVYFVPFIYVGNVPSVV